MPERPDLRLIAHSLRESLDGLTREALVDVLTYVLNEYVVEGPPPLAAGQVEALEDLAGLDLAALITALQTRLDTPGLELFKVDGQVVQVQTPTGLVPLRPGARSDLREPAAAVAKAFSSAPPVANPGRGRAQFHEQPMPAPTGPAERRSSAEEAALRGRGDLAGGQVGVVTPPAPRPRGLSVSGRPSSQTGPAAAAAEPPVAASSAPLAPPAHPDAAPPPARPADAADGGKSSSDGKEDDASIRFSLLELD